MYVNSTRIYRTSSLASFLTRFSCRECHRIRHLSSSLPASSISNLSTNLYRNRTSILIRSPCSFLSRSSLSAELQSTLSQSTFYVRPGVLDFFFRSHASVVTVRGKGQIKGPGKIDFCGGCGVIIQRNKENPSIAVLSRPKNPTTVGRNTKASTNNQEVTGTEMTATSSENSHHDHYVQGTEQVFLNTLMKMESNRENKDAFWGGRCSRCQLIDRGKLVDAWNMSKDMDKNVFRNEIEKIKSSYALIIKVIDVLKVEESFIRELRNLVGGNEIVLVLSKLDLVVDPKDDVSMLRFLSWVKDRSTMKGLNVTNIFATSGLAGFGLQDLAKFIQTYHNGRDVFILGRENTGKSTLVIRLLEEILKITPPHKHPANRERRKRLEQMKGVTVSLVPGTTLRSLRFPCFRSFLHALWDTPGVITPRYSWKGLQEIKLEKDLQPPEPFQPVSALVATGTVLVIGDNLAQVVLHSPNALPDDPLEIRVKWYSKYETRLKILKLNELSDADYPRISEEELNQIKKRNKEGYNMIKSENVLSENHADMQDETDAVGFLRSNDHISEAKNEEKSTPGSSNVQSSIHQMLNGRDKNTPTYKKSIYPEPSKISGGFALDIVFHELGFFQLSSLKPFRLDIYAPKGSVASARHCIPIPAYAEFPKFVEADDPDIRDRIAILAKNEYRLLYDVSRLDYDFTAGATLTQYHDQAMRDLSEIENMGTTDLVEGQPDLEYDPLETYYNEINSK